MKTNFKKLPKSEIEIDFELTAEKFNKYFEETLQYFQKDFKADGFRRGKAPLKMVEEKIGKERLLMEAGDLAVRASYGKFVQENNLEPVGQPQVQILKISKDNPFLFKIKVATLPEIKLPDYKKITSSIKSNEIKVEPKEAEDALNYLQKSRAKFSQVERGAKIKDFVEIEYQNENINGGKPVKDGFILGEGGFLKDFEDSLAGMKNGEEKEFKSRFPENTPNKELADKEATFKVKMISVKEMELPEINDEFAKGLGSFENLEALKSSLKESIIMEKQQQEKQRKRQEILNKISEKIDFEIPENLVSSEKERLFDNFKNKISRSVKITFEQYLASVKKTEQEIKDSFSQEAEKRIQNFLVLREIGKKEGLNATSEETEQETNKIIKDYSQEQLAKFDIKKIKEYIKETISNEKVFEKLESSSKI